MAPSGVPGAAANVLANGGAVYTGLAATVSKKPDYEMPTEESLVAILAMFGRAKVKVAFRARPKAAADFPVTRIQKPPRF